MSSKGDALREAADAIDAQDAKRDVFLAAKARYRADPSNDEAKAEYRALAQEYDALRSAARGMAVAVPTDGRSTTVVPPTVGR